MFQGNQRLDLLAQVGDGFSAKLNAHLNNLGHSGGTSNAEDDEGGTALVEVASIKGGIDGDGAVGVLGAHDVDGGLDDVGCEGRLDGRGREGGEENGGGLELHFCGSESGL